MIKEICEQPRVIRETLMVNDFNQLWPGRPLPASLLIVACGTSFHAGCVGEHVLEELSGIPVTVKLASEINYRPYYPAPPEAIFITQSGETADILQAMKRLKEKGTRCMVITNVPNSSASRLADHVLLICAGPEISVAATKSFLGQLMVLYQLALYLYERHPNNGWGSLHREMAQLPGKIQAILDDHQRIIDCADRLAGAQHAFYIGRGCNYAIAQEGALKLKEISYIHAEACPAGELKHGPLALLEHDSPVIAVTSPGVALTAMLTSIKEVKARDAYVIAVGNEHTTELWQEADNVLSVPDTNPLLSPILNTVVLQLLAYYTAKNRHCPIDFPRNLAKSVTVE
jgi:glucosamine--fructose-6-phosphate aminotransferase (isomerizing)